MSSIDLRMNQQRVQNEPNNIYLFVINLCIRLKLVSTRFSFSQFFPFEIERIVCTEKNTFKHCFFNIEEIGEEEVALKKVLFIRNHHLPYGFVVTCDRRLSYGLREKNVMKLKVHRKNCYRLWFCLYGAAMEVFAYCARTWFAQ